MVIKIKDIEITDCYIKELIALRRGHFHSAAVPRHIRAMETKGKFFNPFLRANFSAEKSQLLMNDMKRKKFTKLTHLNYINNTNATIAIHP